MDINDKRNQSGGQIPAGVREETVILGTRGDVTHPFLRAMPRTGFYVKADDVINFQVTSDLNNLTMDIAWRLILPDGTVVRFEDRPLFTSGGSFQAFNYHLQEGWLVAASCSTLTSFVPEGTTFVQIIIGQATSTQGIVCQTILTSGTIQSFVGVSWPGTIVRVTDGIGWNRNAGVGNPAAGAEWSFLFPNNKRTRIEAVTFTLATSAAVANRFVRLRLDTSGVTIVIFPSGVAQAASQTVTYTFSAGVGPVSGDPTLIHAPLPLYLESDLNNIPLHISTLTNNLQGADQYSAIQLSIRQWHESD